MRNFRKLDKQDFQSRIKRVDPMFHRFGEGARYRDRTEERPALSVLMGFGWAYLVVSIASNRGFIESSLRQGSLPDAYHDHVFGALAVLLAISGVALMMHLFRYFFKSGGKKRNSGAALMGVMGAMALVYTPASVWQTGYGLLDDNSRSFLQSASATVEDKLPGVDLTKVAFVSSFGK